MYLVLSGGLWTAGKLEIQMGLLTIPTSDWSDAMFVNSTVKLDFGTIRKLERAQIIALEQTAEYLHTEVVQAQVVPFDKGVLQGEAMAPDYSHSSQGVVSLVHSTPYARRLYFHPEYQFQTKENPHAKGKWFEDWVDGGKKSHKIKQAYGRLYKQITGV